MTPQTAQNTSYITPPTSIPKACGTCLQKTASQIPNTPVIINSNMNWLWIIIALLLILLFILYLHREHK